MSETKTKNLVKLTGLYKKQTKNGDNYLSGTIKMGILDIYVSIFKNTRKEKDNQPDYNAFINYKDNENSSIPVTGLWKNTTKDGKISLSGRAGSVYLKVFENGYKEAENQPDYNLFFSQILKTDKEATQE
jgi:uncharacterized protein (DUF736 family)